MAAIHTAAHFSIATTFIPNFRPSPPLTPKSLHRKSAPRCTMRPQPQNWRESRRLFSLSISLLIFPSLSSSLPPHAIADDVFDRYLKRKKLEPLESYVPAVLLTQLQIKDLEKSLEVDEPQYAAYRSVLRSGPAASFRSNVRAVAQYASEGGKGKTAFDDVERCLRALDELDSLFLRASRNNPAASPKLMKEKIGVAISSLDSLLQTVPSDVLEKGKTIADAYLTPEIDVAPQELDPELKKLESLL